MKKSQNVGTKKVFTPNLKPTLLTSWYVTSIHYGRLQNLFLASYIELLVSQS